MLHDQLFNPGKPCFYLYEANISDVEMLYMSLERLREKCIIRKVRGNKCRKVTDFFDEISSAFQFPLYFGENWNAFNDCITDLDWLEAEVYIVLISNADQLLVDADDEDFRILIKMFIIANQEWLDPNRYVQRDRISTAFHVIFQCSPSDIEMFSHRLKQFCVEFDTLK